MAFSIVYHQAALEALLRGPSGAVARDLGRRAIRVESRAKQLCPVDTGRLRSSITWRIVFGLGGLNAVVGTNVAYAVFVHEGTAPHRIVAKFGKALYWKGAAHPVKAVNHPGTRAHRFLVDALPAAA